MSNDTITMQDWLNFRKAVLFEVMDYSQKNTNGNSIAMAFTIGERLSLLKERMPKDGINGITVAAIEDLGSNAARQLDANFATEIEGVFKRAFNTVVEEKREGGLRK